MAISANVHLDSMVPNVNWTFDLVNPTLVGIMVYLLSLINMNN